jgi:hypothetical protein
MGLQGSKTPLELQYVHFIHDHLQLLMSLVNCFQFSDDDARIDIGLYTLAGDSEKPWCHKGLIFAIFVGLPAELLYRIFEFLNAEDLFNLSLCCKSCNAVANSKQL